MTPATRQRLKQAVDRRRRQLAADEERTRAHKPCVGCGGSVAFYSPGCETCRTRRNARARRARMKAAA